MLALEAPNTHHLSAAQGWLELGNLAEACASLDRIEPLMRAHPDVLEVKYKICAAANKWTEAMLICRTLAHLTPDRPFSWINLSVALHKLDRTHEAYDTIMMVLERFPENSMLYYVLARYACKLGLLEEASENLRQAFDLGDPFCLMAAALHDPGLRPLWTRLGLPQYGEKNSA